MILRKSIHSFLRFGFRFQSMTTLKPDVTLIQNPKIELTQTEQKIVDILNSYTKAYNCEHKDRPITLRITGGWVRDKLLKHPSHDIDIGIDNCSGETFVLGLSKWLDSENKNKDKSSEENDEDQESLKIHKIKQNPDKSKHLETCTTKLCGLDIDFVNLRSESYTEKSRIPTITTGTAIEDAYRRDATLNAMFFNLETMEIEDLTGKGLQDLRDGILRTPLEPRKTFLDDPLRCLRLIRFASNYGFNFDDATLNAMKDEDLKAALKTKISRERIGVEFRKMIINKRGLVGTLEALEFLRAAQFSCIFDLGDTKIDQSWIEDHKELLSFDILQSIDKTIEYIPLFLENYGKLLDKCLMNDENKILLFFISLILSKWRDTKVKVGKQENYVTYYCVLNGLKLPSKLAEHVSLIVSNLATTREYVNNFPTKRSEIAKRLILPFQDRWELNLVINCVLDVFENGDLDSVVAKYTNSINSIYQLKLQDAYKEQLLLNGKDIMATFNKKPGAWIKPVTEQLLAWQLDHPECSRDDIIEYIKTIDIYN